MKIRRALWGYAPQDVQKIRSLYQLEKLLIETDASKRAKEIKDERESLMTRIKQLTAEKNQLLMVEKWMTRRIGDRENK